MILGIGNDIIEISRIKKACEKSGFLSKCYTEKEVECFGTYPQSLAGNFAAKEAVVKAMGIGFRGFYANSLEIMRDELGKPYVVFYGEAYKIYEKMGKPQVFVTISHSTEYAMATCVIEGK